MSTSTTQQQQSSPTTTTTTTTTNHHISSSSTKHNLFENLIFEKFCSCLELWKGCILAGIFTMSTSVFDLLWSIAHMIDEETVIFFYLLFCLGIESIIFIAAIGILFIALIKRSRCLLLPWLIMTFIDVFFSLLISFAELAIPSNLNINGCTVPAISMIVTLLICFITIYCWLCVYGQYLHYAKNTVNISEIKVTPIDNYNNNNNNNRPNSSRTIRPIIQHQQISNDNNNDDDNDVTVTNLQQSQQQQDNILNINYNNNNLQLTDTLKVPQLTTPKDAW